MAQQNNPHSDIVTGPIPSLPHGFNREALDYMHNMLDEKIAKAMQNVSIRTFDQEAAEQQERRREKLYYGLGGVAAGLVVAWGYRRWFAADRDDDDGDMGNE